MDFSVNVNGNHYRTSQEYFSTSQSVRLAEDLISTDGKVYLEWSEPHGDNQGRLRSSNIVKVNDFKEKFEQCRYALLIYNDEEDEKTSVTHSRPLHKANESGTYKITNSINIYKGD